MNKDCRTTSKTRLDDIQTIRESRLLDPLVFKPFGPTTLDPTLPPEATYLATSDNWRSLTSALFDGGYYLSRYPDVEKSGFNPLLHYIRHGFHEGRNPAAHVDLDYIFLQANPELEIDDVLAFREAKLDFLSRYEGVYQLLSEVKVDPSQFFENDFYVAAYATVDDLPLEDYVRRRGRDTNGGYLECTQKASFAYYMKKYPDLMSGDVIPMVHLARFGLDEGRIFASHEMVDKRFLEATASLYRSPEMRKLSGFLSSSRSRRGLPGAAWPTPYLQRSLPVVSHAATVQYKVVVGVVLYHNSEQELSRLIESVDNERRLTRPHTIDLQFLVNDAREHEYRDLIGSTGRLAYAADNIGFGRGHNRLMQDAYGIPGNVLYVGANPDGYFLPGCIEALVNASDYYGGRAMLEAPSAPVDHPKWHDPINLDTEWVSGACFVLPRALYVETKGFDEQIHLYGEDVDLAWRVKAVGGLLKVCPTARFMHDVTPRFYEQASEEGALTRKISMLKGNYYLAKKWGGADVARATFAQLQELLTPTEMAEIVEPESEVALEIAQEIANFRDARFAYSRFW